MTSNQDIIKASSLFSDKSASLKERSHRYILSMLNNLTSARSFDDNFSFSPDCKNRMGDFKPWLPIEATLCKCTSPNNFNYTVESNIHKDVIRKMSVPDNMTIHKTDNPLDYSIHSHLNDCQYSMSTSSKAVALKQSECNGNSSPESLNNFSIHNNNTFSFRKSSCTSEPVLNYHINNEIDSGRLLKRKYSKNNSRASRKYSEKYIKTGISKVTELNQSNGISIASSNNHNNNNNTDSSDKRFDVINPNTANHLFTYNLLKETCSLNQNVINEDGNMITHKKSKLDKSCPNKQTTNTTYYSTSKNNTWNNDKNKSGKTNDENLNNLEKNTVNATGAYKYLSWREKDRRRRFREEWKHLWLVIPHGLHEVMCLVCHKVMTQRKLDTIKRHVIRRHPELLKMPDNDKQALFTELFIKQPNVTEEDTNVNSSSNNQRNDASQKSNDSYAANVHRNLVSIQHSQKTKEITQKTLLNDNNNNPNWLTNEMNDRNVLKNINRSINDNYIPLFYSPIYQSVFHRKTRDTLNELHQVVKSNSKVKHQDSNGLPKMYHDNMNTSGLNTLPNDWSHLFKVAGSLLPTVTSSSPNVPTDPLDYSTHSNRLNPMRIDMHSLSPNDHLLYTSIIPEKPLLSPDMEINSNCTSFCSQINTQYRKSFTPMTYQSSESSNSLSFVSDVQSEWLTNFRDLEKSPVCTELNPIVNSHTIRPSDKSQAALNCVMNYPSRNIFSDTELNTHDNTSKTKAYSNPQFHLTAEHMVHDYIVNELNQRLKLSMNTETGGDENHASSECESTFSKITGLEEMQSSMITAWYSALINSAKSTNQSSASDIVSSNLHKSIGEPFALSNPELFNTSLHVSNNSDEMISSPRLKQREKSNNSTNLIDSCQSHKQAEDSSYSSKQTNSDLNKFTISSLLNTEQCQTKVPKTVQRSSHSCLDSPNKLDSASYDNSTDSSSQLGDHQKCAKFKPVPGCVPCILCRIHDMNMENSSNVINPNKLYRLNVDSLNNKLFAKAADSYKIKHTEFSCSKHLSSSFYNYSMAIQSKCNNTSSNQFNNNDLYTSHNQLPFIHLFDSNTQPFHSAETQMKCYYQELLRQHFEHIQKVYYTNEKVTSSYCMPINKENAICLNDRQNISSS
ncbi:unnamed protein product [Schistosoma turkestanicum]|nr:unnamed protein product [Schistosoma turkestanicum]